MKKVSAALALTSLKLGILGAINVEIRKQDLYTRLIFDRPFRAGFQKEASDARFASDARGCIRARFSVS